MPTAHCVRHTGRRTNSNISRSSSKRSTERRTTTNSEHLETLLEGRGSHGLETFGANRA